MRPYADSNFFTRLYLPLPEHEAAQALLERASATNVPPLPVTFLHRFEVVNALQLHVFAGKTVGQARITPEQAAVALAFFETDLKDENFIRRVSVELDDLADRFTELSLRHTARSGFRTYDLIHVGSALVLGCDTFWSFDKKSCKLALLVGLAVM